MKAAVMRANDAPLTIEDVKIDSPGPGEVLLKTAASGICHSDLTVIEGGLPFPPPCVLGHEPSGIVTSCQTERSQHQNRDNAMKQLRAKLFEMEMLKRSAEKQALEDSKADIGWGSQIRSYVLDDARIKDLRTGVETRNTQSVLDGALDPFIQASLKQGL